MKLRLGAFGDERLQKGGFLYRRLVGYGGAGVGVRQLGGDRAGEMRITRFLHNPSVTVGEMMCTASEQTRAQVAGRHVLVIEDTSALRVDEKGAGLSFHPVLAVDASAGTVLRLVDNIFLSRQGGERASRKQRAFADKDSRLWLSGAESATALSAAGAGCVTVVEDREGDIYECSAFKPAMVEKLVRTAQDRRLADGTSLFSKAETWAAARPHGGGDSRRPGSQSAPRQALRQLRQGRDRPPPGAHGRRRLAEDHRGDAGESGARSILSTARSRRCGFC